ncbi:hypothetical protein M8C21_006983 [Ambrosia artemisiifolia]|uniref:Uncharacterized protein n=1 Tax=Ambrosia artemisiifolia TaxID=4212 RepID=A0AAD5D326_AMBAR|nr:hypothetical protein M8C21_006983 [Ambrosia artemisiifolia]
MGILLFARLLPLHLILVMMKTGTTKLPFRTKRYFHASTGLQTNMKLMSMTHMYLVATLQ